MSNKRNVGDIVWACNYKMCNNKSDKQYFCKPIKGVLANSYMNHPSSLAQTDERGVQQRVRYFIPMKKRGDGFAWSQAVSVEARHYFDTETECIAEYNRLIDEAIAFHEEEIASLKSNKI